MAPKKEKSGPYMYVWYVCMPVMCVYVLGGVIGMRHTIIKTAI